MMFARDRGSRKLGRLLLSLIVFLIAFIPLVQWDSRPANADWGDLEAWCQEVDGDGQHVRWIPGCHVHLLVDGKEFYEANTDSNGHALFDGVVDWYVWFDMGIVSYPKCSPNFKNYVIYRDTVRYNAGYYGATFDYVELQLKEGLLSGCQE